MNSVSGWIFFLLFVIIQVGMYLAIRREWAPVAFVAGLGIVSTIASVILIALAQGDQPFQAVVVGILTGLVFSLAILSVAWYFHSRELKARYPTGRPTAAVQSTPDDEEY